MRSKVSGHGWVLVITFVPFEVALAPSQPLTANEMCRLSADLTSSEAIIGADERSDSGHDRLRQFDKHNWCLWKSKNEID